MYVEFRVDLLADYYLINNSVPIGMFKTLLVEDNLLYRGVLKGALLQRFAGMETREASDAQAALDILGNFHADLIITDISLKEDSSGLELARNIKLEYPDAVVVILSQYDVPEYRAVASQNGADHFLSKSTSLEKIFAYVDSVVISKGASS